MFDFFHKREPVTIQPATDHQPAPCRLEYLVDVPKRLTHLREKVFNAHARKFAWRFELTVSQLDEIERGVTEPPRTLLESLFRDYRVSQDFIDGKSQNVFAPVNSGEQALVEWLKQGYKLRYIIAPKDSEPRACGAAFPILMKADELLPYEIQCERVEFRFDKGRLGNNLSTTLHAIRLVSYGMLHLPRVYTATKATWSALESHCYHPNPSNTTIGIDHEAEALMEEQTKGMRHPDEEWNRNYREKCEAIFGRGATS